MIVMRLNITSTRLNTSIMQDQVLKSKTLNYSVLPNISPFLNRLPVLCLPVIRKLFLPINTGRTGM